MKKNVVTTYKIEIERPGMESGRIRAAFLTDLHNAVWNQDPDCLPSMIEDQKPDLILCGGDMIIARPEKTVEAGLYFMRKIRQISNVYFALGNHEYRSRIYPKTYGTMYRDFVDPLEKEGVCFLDNSHTAVTVNRIPLNIYGLSLDREKYRRFHDPKLERKEITELIGDPDRKSISILLAHNPKYYRTYLDWQADITLCGHYHGGIVRLGKHLGLLSPGLRPFPNNAYGRFDRNGRSVIISGGLGEHTLPIRLFNPRELVMLDISVNC